MNKHECPTCATPKLPDPRSVSRWQKGPREFSYLLIFTALGIALPFLVVSPPKPKPPVEDIQTVKKMVGRLDELLIELHMAPVESRTAIIKRIKDETGVILPP